MLSTLHFALVIHSRLFGMASSIRRDRFVLIATAAMIGILLCAFVASWLWWRQAHPARVVLDYALIGPLVVNTEAYSLSTRLALQSDNADAAWIKQHDTALRRVLQSALMSLEPQQVRAPGGLAALQLQLLDVIHRQLATDKIEQLLLIDFILQTDV